MPLSDAEKTVIVTLMTKVAEQKEKIGLEALTRVLKKHPWLRPHFSHLNLSPDSPDLKSHGGKVCQALVDGVNHMDHLKDYMSSLQDLHGKKHKLRKETIKLLLDVIGELIGETFPNDFNNDAKVACEKYFIEVSAALTWG